MTRISPARKSAALAKLLPLYNMTVAAVAQMEGISEATLYIIGVIRQKQKENPCPAQTKLQNNAPQQPVS
ncbi:hypothetical protein [Photorhabdus tasmaniensis]